MRLIDADALKKHLDYVCVGGGKWGNAEKAFINAFKDFVDGEITIQLELKSAQQWIPCSEKYPDMDTRVLVYTVANEYHVWDCMPNRADNYFWEDEDGHYHNKYEADLWMPLPWKGEENGQRLY